MNGIDTAQPARIQRVDEVGDGSAFSALSGRPWLLLDTRDALQDFDPARLACPVIGIGTHDTALAATCDTVVPDLAAAQPLLRGIERAPLAAAVLVQVLRSVDGLGLEHALLLESLAYASLQSGAEFRRWLAQNGPPAETAQPAHHTNEPAVLLEREGHCLRLTLNRPENHNAMSVEMRDALIEALELAVLDRSIRALHIAARGRCFSTGGDLREFGTAPDSATAHLVRMLALPGRVLARCADRAEVRVHGACIGSGIEFPAFAGRITAHADSHFQLPELRYGLIPGAGGCFSITRRIGRQRTAWMVLGGKRIGARRALEWGLVDAVVD